MTPLAIYIHWPFCKSKCPYCDFNSHVRDAVDQERWRSALLKELEFMHSHVPGHRVTSIFFGGGTPSLMQAQTVQALIEKVHALWPVSENIEITLEANPTSVETDTFADFKLAGINRVSLGVQSLDEKELKFLGREHSAKEALRAIAQAQKTFARYSFDLIYARPNQTLQTWEKELAQALEYIDGHMSLYQLTIEENTAFHHAYKNGGFTLPDEETATALYLLTEEMMMARGLISYEVSNYAKPGEESRHNLSYWKGDDYIGVGPGAHGRLTKPSPLEGEGWVGGGFMTEASRGTPHLNPPPQGGRKTRIATTTLKSPERWLSAVEEKGNAIEIWEPIDKKTEIEERLMMGLRLAEGINYSDFEMKTGMDLRNYLDAKKIEIYKREKLLTDRRDILQTKLKGRLLLNQLITELLPG